VASQPWEHRFHPALQVSLELGGGLAKMASGAFPGAKISRTDGGARVEVKVTYLEGLVRHALSLGRDCAVVAPDSAVAEYRKMAERIAAAHAEARA
jgi:predicted DNA-binding transcriptional regulator YafY